MNEKSMDPEDLRIQAALRDVDVPADLRERIRSCLRRESEDRLQSQAGCGPNSTSLEAVEATFAEHPVAAQEEAATQEVESQEIIAYQTQADETVRLAKSSLQPRSRRTALRLAAAAALAGLAFGVYQWSQPLTPERLATFCLSQIDQLQNPSIQWRNYSATELVQLRLLERQLHSSAPHGFVDLPAKPFSDLCRVWELQSSATGKRFYVFDFQQPANVARLSRQLSPIDSVSGGWSMVAMRSGERLIVVAFEGDLDDYVYQSQPA